MSKKKKRMDYKNKSNLCSEKRPKKKNKKRHVENVKEKFRKSKEWKEFRCKLASKFGNRDYITAKKLIKGYNVHHLRTDQDEEGYCDISKEEEFIPLNSYCHKLLHYLFIYYRKDKTVINRLVEILDKMCELSIKNNDDIMEEDELGEFDISISSEDDEEDSEDYLKYGKEVYTGTEWQDGVEVIGEEDDEYEKQFNQKEYKRELKMTSIAFENGELKEYGIYGELSQQTLLNLGLFSYGDKFGWTMQPISIHIGQGVTSISDGAFLNCSKMKDVYIGDSVSSIGNYAFQCCESLIEMNLPSSIYSIGEVAFFGCKNLKKITIPSTVMRIGDRAFEGCASDCQIIFQNKTLDQVKIMENYPFGVKEKNFNVII